ncbi:peptidoglycan DD-metalloendopeptidase family protein [Neisseria perflava]|uniref:peptidoglycan DD-metalloendopeptidase family protein n=1 Tax=Neisseria perflava TaxID=33053 RepID=UPI00209D714E|nr:peptidoglycan DD-metalloendopeptidase family protein [Neisseria perflava]
MNTSPLSLKKTLKTTAWALCAVLLAACAGNKTGPVPDGYYRVQQGDTLYRIAKRYGQSVSTLAAWNNIPNSSKIEVGQVLRVKRSGSASRSASGSSSRYNAASARTVTPVNRLNLQWPVDNGRNSVIQRYNGTSSKGIDIAGQRGEPIKAAAAGKVIYVGEGVRSYGKLVLISHNNATITAYAHNDSILVQENQQVRAGQAIASMGSSDADRVKLHFEVRINGKAVDPMPYLN